MSCKHVEDNYVMSDQSKNCLMPGAWPITSWHGLAIQKQKTAYVENIKVK